MSVFPSSDWGSEMSMCVYVYIYSICVSQKNRHATERVFLHFIRDHHYVCKNLKASRMNCIQWFTLLWRPCKANLSSQWVSCYCSPWWVEWGDWMGPCTVCSFPYQLALQTPPEMDRNTTHALVHLSPCIHPHMATHIHNFCHTRQAFNRLGGRGNAPFSYSAAIQLGKEP